MIVEDFMSHPEAHLSGAQRQQVQVRPMRLDSFTVCSSDIWKEVEREMRVILPMYIVVLLWDGESDVAYNRSVDLHLWRKLFHALVEVAGPLTRNVVGDEQGDQNADERGKDNEVHVGVATDTT